MGFPGVTLLFVVGLSGFPRRIFVLSKAACGGALLGFPGVTLLFLVGLSGFPRRHTLQMFDASLLFVVGHSGFPRRHTSLCGRAFRVCQASHFADV